MEFNKEKDLRITKELVTELIRAQFPHWSHLTVSEVAKSGHDNRTFHLGSDMTVRLPSGKDYAPQVEKELFWLPKLKPCLTLPISCPLAKGEPSDLYPYPWSVNQWIEGEPASSEGITDKSEFAADLAGFLNQLQAAVAKDGPAAGSHNFYRGGSLSVYDNETQNALKKLESLIPTDKLRAVWTKAMESEWNKEGVWVHGDIAPGNLLVKGGRLCGVIDFGILGVGDPSCDYAMAWTFFDKDSREVFLDTLVCDEDTRNRARGWALWKALITYLDEEPDVAALARYTVGVIVDENGV